MPIFLPDRQLTQISGAADANVIVVSAPEYRWRRVVRYVDVRNWDTVTHNYELFFYDGTTKFRVADSLKIGIAAPGGNRWIGPWVLSQTSDELRVDSQTAHTANSSDFIAVYADEKIPEERVL